MKKVSTPIITKNGSQQRITVRDEGSRLRLCRVYYGNYSELVPERVRGRGCPGRSSEESLIWYIISFSQYFEFVSLRRSTSSFLFWPTLLDPPVPTPAIVLDFRFSEILRLCSRSKVSRMLQVHSTG